MKFLQGRGLKPSQACAVMGVAMTALSADDDDSIRRCLAAFHESFGEAKKDGDVFGVWRWHYSIPDLSELDA